MRLASFDGWISKSLFLLVSFLSSTYIIFVILYVSLHIIRMLGFFGWIFNVLWWKNLWVSVLFFSFIVDFDTFSLFYFSDFSLLSLLCWLSLCYFALLKMMAIWLSFYMYMIIIFLFWGFNCSAFDICHYISRKKFSPLLDGGGAFLGWMLCVEVSGARWFKVIKIKNKKLNSDWLVGY